MAKVTSKLQVTIPKAVAEACGLRPGSEIDWQPAPDVIRLVPKQRRDTLDRATRLRLFDLATARQKKRDRSLRARAPRDRGWTREELYGRGRAR
jgi:AbrB family looped-hinge helix DNA binding protein